MPTHFVVQWHPDETDDPIRIYEGVANGRTELRKVEELRDGRLVGADSVKDSDTTLTWGPMPDIVEIQD